MLMMETMRWIGSRTSCTLISHSFLPLQRSFTRNTRMKQNSSESRQTARSPKGGTMPGPSKSIYIQHEAGNFFRGQRRQLVTSLQYEANKQYYPRTNFFYFRQSEQWSRWLDVTLEAPPRKGRRKWENKNFWNLKKEFKRKISELPELVAMWRTYCTEKQKVYRINRIFCDK